MILDRIDYNGGEIWVSENAIEQADEGFYVYLSHANVYFTKGVHLLQPFNKVKDHFGLFKPTSTNDLSTYVTIKQDKGTPDLDNGYKFCNTKYLKKVGAQSLGNPHYIEGVPFVEVIEDENTFSYNQAKLIFEESEGRAPNMNNMKDMGAVSAIQLGYKSAQAKQFTEENIVKVGKHLVDMMLHKRSFLVEAEVKEYIQMFMQPKVDSIEIDEELTHEGSGTYSTRLEDLINLEPTKQPAIYKKDGKTFLTIKKINYAFLS